jgi:hypothetical protein
MNIPSIISLLSAIGQVLTPVGVIVTAIAMILNVLNGRKLRKGQDKLIEGQAALDIKTDGMLERIEAQRNLAQAETKLAERATVDATAAGIETAHTSHASGLQAGRQMEKDEEAQRVIDQAKT